MSNIIWFEKLNQEALFGFTSVIIDDFGVFPKKEINRLVILSA
jgi:hypothetical protein